MGKYGIAVYAICRDEAKFARRWAESMREADWVIAMDTGSADGTRELLRAEGVTVVEQTVSPWRFDVARNLALSLVPAEADICVSTDLDELFRPGWRSALEASWTADAKRARCRYTWSFNPDGSEGVVFWADKIHARDGFRWENPVHEVLEYERAAYRTVLAEGVQLNHRPDPEKSCHQYLPLLELAVREKPEDDRLLYYLGREYLYRGMWEKCIGALQRHLKLESAVWPGERSASMRFIARAHQELGNPLEAERWLLRAIAEAPHLREPWVDMASLSRRLRDWDGAAFFAGRALRISERAKSHILEPSAWGILPYDIRAAALYETGRVREALFVLDRALGRAPGDQHLTQMRARVARTLGSDGE
ncbi:MAG: glycosyl transferase family 2 [Clostridiales bacterium]|nr:glycosyl transferase family 2 [Clostridiales bacterium]